MKSKIIYIAAVCFYGVLGITGATGNAYIEVGGTSRMIKENLILLLFLGVTTGVLSFYFFLKIFPKGYSQQNKAGKLFVPLIFPILSFASTVGICLHANSNIGKKAKIEINGIVEAKYKKYRRKGRYDYFIQLKDSASGKSFHFELNRSTYSMIGEPGVKTYKTFYRGSLGVIYRDRP